MIVDTRYGRVAGREVDGVTVFKGIPYAAPPVGDLRFRRRPRPSRGRVRECFEFGPTAPQEPRPAGWPRPAGARDEMLNLNVWTRAARGCRCWCGSTAGRS